MAFDCGHNHKRVGAIMNALDLIDKSAASNKATDEEISAMLESITARLARYRHIQPTSAPDSAPSEENAQPTRRGVTAPVWASIMDCAREASLPDLQRAMGIYLNRLDDHFHDLQDRGEG